TRARLECGRARLVAWRTRATRAREPPVADEFPAGRSGPRCRRARAPLVRTRRDRAADGRLRARPPAAHQRGQSWREPTPAGCIGMSARLDWTSMPSGPLTGEPVVPGDKSISHRAIMLAAL